MADNYIDKIKYDNNRYFLLDSGATHDSNHKLSGTTSNFKSNGTIVAEQGLFNKLIATNASISSLDVNNLTAQNATVVGLLDVQGQLKTNSWTNSNIATIEGNFFIAPTLGTGSSLTTGTTKLTISKTNNIWEITIAGSFLVNQIGADPVSASDTDVNQWSTGSKVLITGEIAKDDGIYPLGTLKGVIKNTPTMDSVTGIATSINITNITDNLGNTEILDILGVGSYYYRNIKISLTQRKYGSSNIESENMRPIGILMSAQGRSSKSFIDIYGGANKLEEGAILGADSDYGGLAIPNVRIGNLRGLPSVGNQTPTGWGIYTDNGYFKGTIVANTGEIGRFTIANDLYCGQLGGDDSVWISSGTEQTASIGGSASSVNNWAFTAGDKFGVTAGGDLYASNAIISGTITITNNNSNIYTKDEAEGLTNAIQNTIEASLNDLSKVVNIEEWILKYGYCELTNDTEVQEGKLYFNIDKQVVIPTVNPQLQDYYELESDATWILTTDTIIDGNKQYYKQYAYYTLIELAGNENPSEEDWYELSNDTYIKTTDTIIDGNKQYYEQHTYYTPVKPIGNENPFTEQWYELSDDTYEATTDTTLVNNKLYFLQFLDNSINPSIYYISVEPIGNENPSEQQWYELSNDTYILTSDTIVDENKQYYELHPIYYTLVEPAGDENPFEQQWYELSNDTYIPTSDTIVDENKQYYEQHSIYFYKVITEYIPNPAALGLYELTRVDTSISDYINTHIKLENGAIIIQADDSDACIHISMNGIVLKDKNGTPVANFAKSIILGNKSQLHLELSPGDVSNNTPPELGFYDGDIEVAYINSDTLNINQGEIKEKLRIGQFEWKTQGANRISLVYAPQN